MINSHFIGRDPNFRPYMASSTTVSLSVRQFVQLARRELAVQAPANDFKVEAVRAEELYCLKCLVVRWFDVVYPSADGSGESRGFKRCRVCGDGGVE